MVQTISLPSMELLILPCSSIMLLHAFVLVITNSLSTLSSTLMSTTVHCFIYIHLNVIPGTWATSHARIIHAILHSSRPLGFESISA